MDDAFGSTYPNIAEAGMNAAHYTTPHMELMEGKPKPLLPGRRVLGQFDLHHHLRNHLTSLLGAMVHSPITFVSGGSRTRTGISTPFSCTHRAK